MLVNRTSLLTFAAVATLAMAATTSAEAFCPGMGHHGGMSQRSMFQPRVASKPATVRPKAVPQYSKVASRKRPAAEPVKSASVANSAKLTSLPAKSASLPSPAKSASLPSPAKSASLPSTAKSTSLATVVGSNGAADAAASTSSAAAANGCISKEYLDTGAVRFKDSCTKEWAINSTHVVTKASTVVPACLTKDTNQDGVVMFKDVCTNEWAMNTADQIALAQTQ